MDAQTTRSPREIILLACMVGIGIFMCVSTARYANNINGGDGFPLDDAWIHLQFARNIHDYGSYSYFKNEMVTSGSTSPLYTLLLSLAFFVTSNEMMMSYALGIACFVLGAITMFKVASLEFNRNNILAGTAAFLFLCEPRLLWASLSGMETTLFIFLLLTTYYYYRLRKPLHLGIAGGLLLWARPEAILFMFILGLDVAYHELVRDRVETKKRQKVIDRFLWMKQPLALFTLFAIAYIAWNLWLSGSIFPNTYAAKLKYYAKGGSDYPQQVYAYFTGGHQSILAILVVIGVLSTLIGVLRRKAVPMFVPLLFGLEMFFVYWKDLPYLYQEGRYLMPVLPFFILLGVGGAKALLEFLSRGAGRRVPASVMTGVMIVLVGVPCAQYAKAGWQKRIEYAEYCSYISNRQVKTARWLRDNLPPDARIATHDVGAIAYYSGRRIVDMVGLISPDMIARLGSLDGLVQFMTANKVTHLAVLRNWFEVDNESPLFQTDVEHPEIMEVFAYHPKQIHFLSRDVGQILEAGEYYAAMNDIPTAGKYFAQAVQRDPRSSKGHRLLGGAFYRVGKYEEAGREFQFALQLNAGDRDARAGQARVAVQQNRIQDAIRTLEGLTTDSPEYPDAYRLLAQIYKEQKDSAKAKMYTMKLEELGKKGTP